MSVDIGIVGPAHSGKSTLFSALAGGKTSPESSRASIGSAKIPDARLEAIAGILHPRRVVPTEIRYIDIGATIKHAAGEGLRGELLNRLSQVDALISVVNSFSEAPISSREEDSDLSPDISDAELELVFSDLAIIERRQEKILVSLKGAPAAERQVLEREQALLARIRQSMEQEIPLREQGMSPEELKLVASYQFLSAKPLLILVNIGEAHLPGLAALEEKLNSRYRRPKRQVLGFCAQLEKELAEMDETDAQDFRTGMGLPDEPGSERIIRASYDLLELIAFFTPVSEEVRAWPLPNGASALTAAGKIHSDMARGFIRAEVIDYPELKKCGSLTEAKRQGLVRLEGKNYTVRDGDIITFLFNV